MWKGSNLYQLYYNAADLRFSDHRPVCAKFICTINVIDESLKAQLRQALYDERQHGMHDVLAKGTMQVDNKDREAIQATDIIPALPPASSDNQKWWLDDGMFLLCYIYVVFVGFDKPHLPSLFLFLSPSVLLVLTFRRCPCEVNHEATSK